MTRKKDVTAMDEVMELICENGMEGLDQAISILVNQAMIIERARVLQAEPYERTDHRQGYANGFKPKTLKTRIGELNLQVPQVRGDVSFYPSAIERGVRSERALKLAIAEMYLKGVSTRKVTTIVGELCGFDITSTQVSRATQELDTELEKWRCRPLGVTPFVQLDASYEKVRVDGSVRSCAVLIASGVTADGYRTILGLSVSMSEAEIHWRDFLLSLKERGLRGIEIITSDDHEGLKAALRATFPGASWQRCQVHLQRNAMAYVPKVHMRETVAADIRAVFNAPDREEAQRLLQLTAEKYRSEASRLAIWMEDNIPEGFACFNLPLKFRRRLRTTNMLERIHKEIKRRTRVATLFPNEAALLRLITAILAEVSEEWESGRKYLTIERDQTL